MSNPMQVFPPSSESELPQTGSGLPLPNIPEDQKFQFEGFSVRYMDNLDQSQVEHFSEVALDIVGESVQRQDDANTKIGKITNAIQEFGSNIPFLGIDKPQSPEVDSHGKIYFGIAGNPITVDYESGFSVTSEDVRNGALDSFLETHDISVTDFLEKYVEE